MLVVLPWSVKERQSGCWRPTSTVKGREDDQDDGSVCSGAAMFAVAVLVTCRVCVVGSQHSKNP